MGSYLKMLRVVKFVLDTKAFCLKIHPKIEKKLESQSILWQWLGWRSRNKDYCYRIYCLSTECTCMLAFKGSKRRNSFEQQSWVCHHFGGNKMNKVHLLLPQRHRNQSGTSAMLWKCINWRMDLSCQHALSFYSRKYWWWNHQDRLKENNSNIFTKSVNQETYERHVKNFLGNTGIEDIGCTFRDRKGIGYVSLTFNPV